MGIRVRDAQASHGRRPHCAPATPFRDALRRATTTLLFIVAAIAGFAVMTVVGPSLMSSAPPAAAGVSPVDRLAVEHDCSGVRAADKPLLLIRTPARGAELIVEATDPDGRASQVNQLVEERADWYGWCRVEPVR